MKIVKCEKLPKSMVDLQFSVEAESFTAAVDKAFQREKGRYAVPGFRKGKAPRSLIEKMYGADVFHVAAINDLFPENYEAAVKEAGLNVVGQPEPEIVSESLEEGFVISAKVPVKPEVTVGEYKGLKATRTLHKVTENDIGRELTRLQERNARQLTREGAARNGDIADIDFEGFVDSVAFEGGKGEHYPLTLGSGSFIPGFEEQIVGHAAGESFDVNVTFPAEYQEDLAGKPATFKVTLNEVRYKELPELDDEFAKDVSEYDTLEELKANERKTLEEQRAKQADGDVENTLVAELVKTLEGEIPDAMFANRARELVNDYSFRLEQNGLKLDDYLKYTGQSMEALTESFRQEAERQVKTRLALEAVAAKEGIEVSAEEYQAELQKITDQFNASRSGDNKLTVEQIGAMVTEADVKGDLAVNKAIDLIRAAAEIETKEVDLEDAAKAAAEKVAAEAAQEAAESQEG